MKKSILSFAMAASLISASMLNPVPANAALGLITGNVPLIVIGAVVTALNTSVFVSCVGNPHFHSCGSTTVIGGTGGLIGLLLLDGEKNQSVPFAPLSTQDASSIGVTDVSQIDAYNHELDEINGVRADILSDVLLRTNRGEKMLGSEVHAAWMNAKDQGLISPQAFAVVEKVSAQAVTVLDAQNK